MSVPQNIASAGILGLLDKIFTSFAAKRSHSLFQLISPFTRPVVCRYICTFFMSGKEYYQKEMLNNCKHTLDKAVAAAGHYHHHQLVS